jgi:hypothetical protein
VQGRQGLETSALRKRKKATLKGCPTKNLVDPRRSQRGEVGSPRLPSTRVGRFINYLTFCLCFTL